MTLLENKRKKLKKIYSSISKPIYNINIYNNGNSFIDSNISNSFHCYIHKKKNNLFVHINNTKQKNLTKILLTPNILLKKKIGKKIKGRKSNIQHQQRVFNQFMKFLKSNYSKSFLVFVNTEQNINNWFFQDLKKKKWFRLINQIKWIPKKQFN